MPKHTLAAFTPKTPATYPPYVAINVCEDSRIEIVVRSGPRALDPVFSSGVDKGYLACGETGTIQIELEQLRDLLIGLSASLHKLGLNGS